MHALVPGVLLMLTGLDGLGPDAEANEPDTETAEACETDGSEGPAVVGADDLGQAVLAEGVDEDRHGAIDRCGVEPLTGEQVAAEDVLAGEGIAVAGVLHFEMPFEVDRPDVIAGLGHG